MATVRRENATTPSKAAPGFSRHIRRTIGRATTSPSANDLETLWPQGTWNCTELFTGNKTPMVSNGINRRIFQTTNPGACPAYGKNGHNNWEMFDPTKIDPPLGFPQGDPRIVG